MRMAVCIPFLVSRRAPEAADGASFKATAADDTPRPQT